MNIVIDTNRFISAIIKSGLSRKIILDYELNLLFPEFELEETYNHKEEIIKKGKFDEKGFNIILLRLLKYVRIIPTEVVAKFNEIANEIIGKIDPDDKLFIATALAFNCPIWSDDKHFKKQDRVKVFTTKEIVKLLEK